MRRFRGVVLPTLMSLAGMAAADDRLVHVRDLPPLPEPVANNAVAVVRAGGREFVVSFAGIAAGKTHADTLDKTYVLDTRIGEWHEAARIPGEVGRLAAAAATAGSLAYVFGGYSVAADGSEASTPFVHSLDPITGGYTSLESMPVPVDDSLALAYADRYIYLISGWHDLANVNLVQRYDTQTNTWVQATPIPSAPVFGHAGGIVGNRIVYCDGVAVRAFADRPRAFAANDECYIGTIDAEDSRRIDWRTISSHPGPPRYRMAAAGIPDRNSVLFVGGSDNPYNFNGIGYDGNPSEPVRDGLRFNIETSTWQVLRQEISPTMDHRGLIPLDGQWLTVGGMTVGQDVSARVIAYSIREQPD